MRNGVKSILRALGYELRRLPGSAAPQEPTRDLDHLRLRECAKAMQSVKLHFGCGPRVLKGWINIDLAYEPYEAYMRYYTDEFYGESVRGTRDDFFAFDITKVGLPLPDNSVDVIFHEDFIEHLDQKSQVVFLAETLRVLRPDAVHRVNTPNLLEAMKLQSRFSEGIRGVFVEEWEKHGHKSILTPKSLEELALMVGYSRVIFTSRDQSRSPLLPKEYRPDHRDRPAEGNVFADLIA